MADKNNVFVGVTGKFLKLDPRNQVITSADQEITGIDYGYLSEDGIEISNDKSTENRSAWQNADIVRTLTTEASTTFTFTIIEDTQNARELYFGSAETGGKITWNPAASAEGRFALAVEDPTANGGRSYKRLFVFDGTVSSVEPITIANSEVIGYGITITTLGATEVFTSVVEEDEEEEDF